MSDGTAMRRRGLTKTHKRVLGAAGSIAVVVLVFVFVLPQIADYRDVFDVLRDLALAGLGAPRGCRGAQPRHVPAAVDGRAARARLPGRAWR